MFNSQNTGTGNDVIAMTNRRQACSCHWAAVHIKERKRCSGRHRWSSPDRVVFPGGSHLSCGGRAGREGTRREDNDYRFVSSQKRRDCGSFSAISNKMAYCTVQQQCKQGRRCTCKSGFCLPVHQCRQDRAGFIRIDLARYFSIFVLLSTLQCRRISSANLLGS